MDSTDEKLHKTQQLMREAEAKEAAKRQQKEIAKRRLDPNYQPDNSMQGISSMDADRDSSVNPIEATKSSESKNSFKDQFNKKASAGQSSSKPNKNSLFEEVVQSKSKKAP